MPLAFLLRGARHALHDLLLATYRGGSHLTSDIYTSCNLHVCRLQSIHKLADGNAFWPVFVPDQADFAFWHS